MHSGNSRTTGSTAFRWIAWLAAGVIGLAGGSVALRSASADERVTDEQLAEMFKRSHSVMKNQRQRIHRALDGFLVGDLDAIQRHVDEIAEGMETASRSFPPKAGNEADQWETMAELLRQAAQMKQAAARKKYDAAYQHFSAMTYQCLKCHQARRDWGAFPAPEPATQKSPDAGDP